MKPRKKTGGRKAGTPNKSTQEMRDFMQAFLESKLDDLNEVFEQLKPKDKINALIKLLPYLMPKQMQMDVQATHKQVVKHDLSKLSDSELHKLLEMQEKINPDKK